MSVLALGEWHLHFVQSRPNAIEAFERTLAAIAYGPMTTTYEPYRGNARDFYARTVWLRGRRDDIVIELRLRQYARTIDDPDPLMSVGIAAVLRSASVPFATKLACWDTVRDALAKLGCFDRTVELDPVMIVAEAVAAGDFATAARLRAEIAAVRQADVTIRKQLGEAPTKLSVRRAPR